MIAAFMVPQEPEKKPKYIEREAAYPLAKKICDAIDSEDFQRLNFGMRILDWIDDIPAADVRPVVRGEWEEVEVVENDPRAFDLIASMRCNKCNRYHNEVYHHGRVTEMAHFCSFCGADMRNLQSDSTNANNSEPIANKGQEDVPIEYYENGGK